MVIPERTERRASMPDRMAWRCVGLLVLCVCIVGAGCESKTPESEDSPMTQTPPTNDGTAPEPSGPPLPTPKRAGPPRISPVVFEQIRYQQTSKSSLEAGEDGQRTGFLSAYRDDTDELLWTIKVYDLAVVKHLERDVQEVYFTSMELVPGEARLRIVNERGDTYVVNLADRTVTPAE